MNRMLPEPKKLDVQYKPKSPCNRIFFSVFVDVFEYIDIWNKETSRNKVHYIIDTMELTFYSMYNIYIKPGTY